MKCGKKLIGGVMKLITARFGEIEYTEEGRVTVVGGLLGFYGLTKFVFHRPEELGIFQWLQSEEVPELAFVVCDPRVIVPDYHISVSRDDLASIEADSPVDAEILTILAYPHDPSRMTANLLGPLIVNRPERLVRQVVISDAKYSAKHRVFPHLKENAEESSGGASRVKTLECA